MFYTRIITHPPPKRSMHSVLPAWVTEEKHGVLVQHFATDRLIHIHIYTTAHPSRM